MMVMIMLRVMMMLMKDDAADDDDDAFPSGEVDVFCDCALLCKPRGTQWVKMGTRFKSAKKNKCRFCNAASVLQVCSTLHQNQRLVAATGDSLMEKSPHV